MIRTPILRLLPVLFIMTACVATQPGDSASSSSASTSSSVSSVAVPTKSGSTVYRNDGYGFSLTLPSHFEAFKGIEPSKNKYGAYIEDNSLQFRGTKTSLMTIEADDTVIDASFAAYVNVVSLKDYNRIELYDTENEYLYDADTDSWSGAMSKKTIIFDSRIIDGKKAYEFGFGDAGWSVETYAVPIKEKDIVVEFIFGSCVGCTKESLDGLSEDMDLINANDAHIKKETEEILKSVRFE